MVGDERSSNEGENVGEDGSDGVADDEKKDGGRGEDVMDIKSPFPCSKVLSSLAL